MTGLETILQQHDAVSVTANWKGSPNPKDWRNIRRICKCGTVIERHQIEQKPGRSYPLGGFPFDPPHRAHVADQIRGWLLSDEVIEQAGSGVSKHEISGRGDYCSCCPTNEDGARELLDDHPDAHLARAAITAALDTTEDS